MKKSCHPLLILLLSASPLSAQLPESAEIGALRLSPDQEGIVRLDGVLSEAFWGLAPVISDFRQQEPQEGAPGTEATEVRVVIGETMLYVGIVARDSEPDRIVSRILQRDRIMELEHGDFQFTGDDAVAILFDPFHDSKNAFVFARSVLWNSM